ncbi:unnamed protein product [Microthlaspi erraticum]|uniref:DUF4283 domain-containing protein n=1 Tax=Microthlaspi erraticum TaxID=1685480 RepID=A0A6D2J673_9BRAS|nr:unnamed protein product [Microthlaspi erraticum]
MESSDGARVLETNDAMIEDMPRKDQPPGEPPDGGTSWASMVSGTSSGGRPRAERLVSDEFVVERLSVEFPNGEDGEPVITIGHEVLDAMNGLWKQCMLVKVLGRNVPIVVLSRKLRELWRPQGAMSVLDLPRGFFLVRFGVEEEYMAALTGGPWKAFGSYLLVKAWSPEFDPMRNEIVTTPVWVRLSNLPVNFYHRAILLGIAKGLGKPLRVDQTTLNVERARFARVCVQVNLRHPLKGSVMVNGERYYVAYEGLTNICSGCGIYGHLIHSCPKNVPLSAVVAEEAREGEGSEVVVHANQEDGFTMVRRPRQAGAEPRRPVNFTAGKQFGNPRRALKEIPQNQGLRNIPLSNTFERLREDTGQIQLGGEGRGMKGDKENSSDSGMVIFGKNTVPSKEAVLGGDSQILNRGLEGVASERRTGPSKGPFNGGRRKPKSNQPSRGLIFGPIGHEFDSEFTTSGKRLRVESEVSGRAGGRFTGENSENGKTELGIVAG